MRDLTARVTSSLLQFPEVTIQALGEDEISLDSVLRGKFSGGRNGLAWLACGPQLEVVSSVTGERRSAYRFSGVNEQPPTVRVVKEFSWQKRTGLLVGLEEAEGSVLCLYDLGISRVAKAVVLPGRVTAIEPITNHGGPSVSTQHLHQSLRWLFGVAAVATDVGHLLLVDLCLDDLACRQNETEASGLEVVTGIPAEVPQRRETVTREWRHLCFQLQNPSGTAISTLCYISRSNQLVVGFSDGYLSLWDMKTLKREHHSQLEGGRIPVYAVTFQEPENDPRNCCYLWAVQSTQESEGDVVSLHLLQLAFADRKRLASGQVMYEVTAIEPITNHGGPSVSTQHLHQSLRWLFGVAAVATDVGHLLLVDLCLDDLACRQNETEASGLEVVTGIPAEVPQRRETVTREGRHLCFQLQNPSGTAISTLCYISRSNQLVVGFSDGYLSLWDMKTLKREHHSQLEGGRIPVYAVTFQEPENDPRNCCYLWAVQSTQESEGDVVSLHLLQLAFADRKRLASGQVMYEVTAIEPITNHGGPSVSTQHLHQSLRWLFGVAAVATDVGHLLLVDLCLDDLACRQNETEASGLEVVTGIPAEVPQRRETVTREGRHLCFQLQNPSGTAISTLCYISRSNQLVVGFSDGYLSLWDMKTLKREHHSQLEGGRIPVYAVTFQEPENDPRNCCYLWAVQSTQESEGDVVSLHLLQLAFADRKRLASGQVMYEGLEYCDERYSLDLTGGVFPLRGQTSNTKLLSCQTIEKFRNHVDREDSVNEVVSPETSVSIFSWQVNTHGQGKPSTYLGVFDINRWYHAQMPGSLRPEEFLHENCPYFALWSLDTVVSVTSPNLILDILVRERSLSRGVPPSYPPPEQFFHPSTYNFDGTCLLNSGVVHMTCTGFQKEEEQLEAVLSAAVQAGSLELLTGCIKHWTSEEQPSSAANLRFVLEWTWKKVIYTKDELDQTCVPLFDGSCNFIDPQTSQSLQHCQLLLRNLSTVLNCFLTEAQELTEKGFADLTNKQVVTSLISLYAQVVTWFCRSSLLPEGLDDDTRLSRPFYNYPLIQSYYTGHRQTLERLSRGKWDSDCLMIDGMVSQLGDQVEKLWRRDEGGTGKYPPATLHALLDLYLLENIEESYKHAITIYLLLDIMHSFPNKTETSVDSFPTAFAIPWGLVKLIQGFWLLDHNDYESSLALLFHPATIKTVSWQHRRILHSLMCQGEHRRALRYVQMMKPSTSSSSEVRLFLTVLLSNRCVVEAWGLLQRHTTKLNIEELLKHMYEICQEMGLMEDLLKLPFTGTEQECLEKFLQTSAGVQNHEFLLVHHLQRASYIPALQLNQSMKVNLTNDRDPRLRERAVARNSLLDQYGKILPRVQRTLAVERAKPYHSPSSVLREVARPKPLSTVTKQDNAGNVHTRATFIKNVLSKIGEVRVGHEQKTSLSQYDRLLDSVVHPVPSCSAAQSPCRASTSFMASSPLNSNMHGSVSQKTSARASELNLLETPLVVKVTEDSAVKAQTSEEAPEPSPYSELHQGALQYSYDTIEQQYACDLPDNKDGECDAAEGDGELFISQSNFQRF
ncbi:LOW QUALITY PROTEIN: protein ELYS-like [Spheniscus humboldti]